MGALARRVGSIERTRQEARLRRMATVAGCPFEEFRREVRELTPKVTAWRAAGITGRRVLAPIVRDAAEGCDFTEDEFREAVDEAERFLRDEVRGRWAR